MGYNETSELFQAIGRRDLVECEIQISRGADVNGVGYGSSPLYMASEKGCLDICLMLLDRGARIVQDYYDRRKSSLTIACQKGHLDVCKLLLKKGRNIDHYDYTNGTPLIQAVINNKEEVCKYLIQEGVGIDLKNRDGETALMKSCEIGQVEIYKKLLEKRANVEEKNNKGETALIIACKNKKLQTTRLLLEYGANIQEKNNQGKTSLMISVENKDQRMYELLLEFGADINRVDKDSKSAFLYACESGNMKICEDLLQRGVDVNQQMCCALKTGCRRGDLNLCILLMEKGGNIENNEALKLASLGGYKKICEIIVQKRNERRWAREREDRIYTEENRNTQEGSIKKEGSKEEDICQICLEEIDYKCPGCNKKFHKQCIERNKMYRNTCPNCRRVL